MCNSMTLEKTEEIRVEIKSILIKALDKLYDTDEKNIKDEVSERNLCARLAMYIEQEMKKYIITNNFNGYYVDVEYNRMENQEPKRDSEDNLMVCDLLIHSRGEKKPDNLLALEMKKSAQDEEAIEKDQKRLEYMTSQGTSSAQNTLLGAFVVIGKDSPSITYYKEGKEEDRKEA